MSYPIFVPPEDLVQVDVMKWTKKQADRYFEWFMDGYEGRVRRVLEYLDGSPGGPAEDLLERIGYKARNRLRSDPELASVAEETLTNHGYALAADIGLLMGRCLFEAGKGRIHWAILRGVRGPKNVSSRNLPVLQGFINDQYVDPLHNATMMAFGVLRDRDGDAWRKVYEYWVAQIPTEAR